MAAWISDGTVQFSRLYPNLQPRFPQEAGPGFAPYAPVDGELVIALGRTMPYGMVAYLFDAPDGGRSIDLHYINPSGLVTTPHVLPVSTSANHLGASSMNYATAAILYWQDDAGAWSSWANAPGTPGAPSMFSAQPATMVTMGNDYNYGNGTYFGNFANYANLADGYQHFCLTSGAGCGTDPGTRWGPQGEGLKYVSAVAADGNNKPGVAYVDDFAAAKSAHFVWVSGPDLGGGPPQVSFGALGAAPAGGFRAPAIDELNGNFGIGFADGQQVGLAYYFTSDGGYSPALVSVPFQTTHVAVDWLSDGVLGYAAAPTDGGIVHVGARCFP